MVKIYMSLHMVMHQIQVKYRIFKKYAINKQKCQFFVFYSDYLMEIIAKMCMTFPHMIVASCTWCKTGGLPQVQNLMRPRGGLK